MQKPLHRNWYRNKFGGSVPLLALTLLSACAQITPAPPNMATTPIPSTSAPVVSTDVSLADVPSGWSVAGNGWKRYRVTRDTSEARNGRASLRVSAEPGMTLTWPKPWEPWAAAVQSIEAKTWRGKRVRLSAYLKTENVMFAAIWMRVDDDERYLQFDNMSGRAISDTTGWNRYDVVLDVPDAAVVIAFGTLLQGGGQMWADDFELTAVDGTIQSTNSLTPKDIAEAKRSSSTPDDPQATNRRPISRPFATPRNRGFEQ